MAVIGLSGGGPYALASAAAMPDRVVAAGVLGGVAPFLGDEGITSGLMNLGKRVAPLLRLGGDPLRIGASLMVRAIRPFANTALFLYAAISPEGDRRLLTRPEFGAMFLDDLLNGSRKQLAAPSTTSSCSPGTGDSGSTRSKCRSAGGTATATTSFRSPTASTPWPCCPTPS